MSQILYIIYSYMLALCFKRPIMHGQNYAGIIGLGLPGYPRPGAYQLKILSAAHTIPIDKHLLEDSLGTSMPYIHSLA